LKDEVDEFFRQKHADYIASFNRLAKKNLPVGKDFKQVVDKKLNDYSKTATRPDLSEKIKKI
jgi:hypothetical protein